MLCTIGLDLLLTVSAPFLLVSPLFTSVCVFISTVCFLKICKIFILIAPFFGQNNHFQSKSLSTFFGLSMETEARNNEILHLILDLVNI